MSKDIWHTADVKPKSLRTFVYKTDKGYIGTSKLAIDSGWNPVLLPEFYSMDDFDKAERIIKWCYLDDLFALETENKDLSDKIGKLETELEKVRKALDVAVDALKTVRRYTAINQFAPKSREAHIVAKKALKQIMEEQKD